MYIVCVCAYVRLRIALQSKYRTRMHARAHAHMLAHIRARMHTCTRVCAHARMHAACVNAHAHAYAHFFTYFDICTCSVSIRCVGRKKRQRSCRRSKRPPCLFSRPPSTGLRTREGGRNRGWRKDRERGRQAAKASKHESLWHVCAYTGRVGRAGVLATAS